MPPTRIPVPPTKHTLIALRRQVAFLQQGYELLERKRELLTRLVYDRIGEYRRLRRETRESVARAYRWLGVAHLRMGSRALQQAGLGTSPGLRIDIIPKRSLGIEHPSMQVTRLPVQPLGLLGTDASFDETRDHLTDAALLLARLGESETALGRLLAEQRKAQKRVNALRYHIIPRYRHTIAHIEGILEEEERTRLYQIKLLRERAEESDGPNRRAGSSRGGDGE